MIRVKQSLILTIDQELREWQKVLNRGEIIYRFNLMVAIQLLYNYNIMEVIVIGSEAWKALIFEIEETRKLIQAMFEKMSEAAQDRWLSPKEAAEYTGFKQAWIKQRSAKIGAFQDGMGLRYKRSDIDKYMKENSFKSK